jgi:hypothetical protein
MGGLLALSSLDKREARSRLFGNFSVSNFRTFLESGATASVVECFEYKKDANDQEPQHWVAGFGRFTSFDGWGVAD